MSNYRIGAAYRIIAVQSHLRRCKYRIVVVKSYLRLYI